MNLRRKNNLPPYERFISLILTAKDEKKLENESLKLKKMLLTEIDARILGPVNAPIYRINKRFRSRILIRSKKTTGIQKSLSSALKNFQFHSEIKLTVDVDPISFN